MHRHRPTAVATRLRRFCIRGAIAAGAAAMLAVPAAADPPPRAAAKATPAASRPAGDSAPPKAAPRRVPVTDLTHRLDLRGPFNLGRGKVRIVTFLSPTCTVCITNAARLQQILDSAPGDDIEIHAVWVSILDTDSRESVTRAATVLSDDRAHHYWDPKRVLNYQLLDAIAFDVQLRMYDVFLLYDQDAEWDTRLPPPAYWMHEYKRAPGPVFDPSVFAAQIAKLRRGEALTPTR